MRNFVTVQAFFFALFEFSLSQFKQSNVSSKHIHWLHLFTCSPVHCSLACRRLHAHARCIDFDGCCRLVGINLTILPLSVCLINVFSGRKNFQFHNWQIILINNKKTAIESYWKLTSIGFCLLFKPFGSY